MDLLKTLLNELPVVWQYAEPMMWLGGALVALFWYARRRFSVWRMKSRYSVADEKTVIVVEVGRDAAAAVATQLGQVDYVIRWDGLLADIADYRKVVGDVKKILGGTTGEIHLVVAGPLALAFVLGQEFGKFKSRVIFYQYTGGKYMPLDTWEV